MGSDDESGGMDMGIGDYDESDGQDDNGYIPQLFWEATAAGSWAETKAALESLDELCKEQLDRHPEFPDPST